MSHGSQVYNQAIAHLAFQAGGRPFCNSRTAHIVCAAADAAKWCRICKRCENKAKQMAERSAKKAALPSQQGG